MRSQKRDQSTRAFQKGYLAGIDGRSRSACPHEQGAVRQHWLTGWREGREDHWNGYNRFAQAQRISNF